MNSDWYRNTNWDPATEQTFNDKLKRARLKNQYLLVQANALTTACPNVSLHLLDRYFALGTRTLDAEAFEIRARALLVQGRLDESVEAYEAALKREDEFPHVRTNSRLDLPLLIARRRLKKLYPRAIELVSQSEGDESLMLFPVARFQCYAARAFIRAACGAITEARAAAAVAIDAAEQEHSGFPRHPNAGLVTSRHQEIVEELNELLG